MTEYQERFARYNNGKPYVAVVKIVINKSAFPDVEIDCKGDEFTSQGNIEYVPKIGYESWKQGAVIGAKYALKKSEKSNISIKITEIAGLTTDTSPAAVGAATVYAVWKAIEYIPTEDEKKLIENIVFSCDYEELPSF